MVHSQSSHEKKHHFINSAHSVNFYWCYCLLSIQDKIHMYLILYKVVTVMQTFNTKIKIFGYGGCEQSLNLFCLENPQKK